MGQKQISTPELPFDFNGFEMKYGRIRTALLECSGVYYVTTETTPDRPYSGHEYYIVTENSPAISPRARIYGTPIAINPLVLLYRCDDLNKAKCVIQYEIYKYLTGQHLPLPESVSLLEAERLGMEICPEYFGEFPVPTETPWGPPLRHDRLWNSLYWLETKQAGWVLSIAYPLYDDLSDTTRALAQITGYDQKNGIDNTLGCLFYTYRSSCLPIFELLDYGAETWGPKINTAALKNAILEFYPEYARNSPSFPLDERFAAAPYTGNQFYEFT